MSVSVEVAAAFGQAVSGWSPFGVFAALVATLTKWSALVWAFLASYAPLAAAAPTGYLGWLATTVEAVFGSSVKAYMLRLFAVNAVPNAVRAFREAWSSEGSWLYLVLSKLADWGDTAASWYGTVAWTAVSGVTTRWVPPWVTTLAMTGVGYATSTVGIVLITVFISVVWLPGAAEYLSLWARGEKLPRRNLFTKFIIFVGGSTKVLVTSMLGPVGAVLWHVLGAVFALARPVTVSGVQEFGRAFAGSFSGAWFKDPSLNGHIAALNVEQETVFKAIEAAVADFSKKHPDEVVSAASTGQLLAAALPRHCSCIPDGFRFGTDRYMKAEVFLDGKRLGGIFTNLALFKSDLLARNGGNFRFFVEQEGVMSDQTTSNTISPIGMFLLTIRFTDFTNRVRVVSRHGVSSSLPSKNSESAAGGKQKGLDGGSAEGGAAAQKAAAGAPTTETKTGRLNGLPAYEANECWAAAIALLLHKMACATPTPKSPAQDLRNLLDRSWVWKSGATAVAKTVGREGLLSDATRQIVAVMKHVMMSKSADSGTLADAYFVGSSTPTWATSEPVGALIFDKKRKHWMAATNDHGTWWLHDAHSTRLTGRPEAERYVWLRALTQDGGAPRTKLAAQKAACKCGKPEAAHRGDKWQAKCGRCGGTWIGSCSGVPRGDRNIYGPKSPWFCPGCVGSVGGRGKKPQQVAARNRAAAAAAARPPLVVPLPASRRAQQRAAVQPAAGQQQQQQQQQQRQQQPAAVPHFTQGVPQHVPFESVGQLFRCSQGVSPALAALKGDALHDLLIFSQEQRPAEGLAAATHQRHRVALAKLKAGLMADQSRVAEPLDRAMLAWVRAHAKERDWKAGTMVRELGNLAGAFSNLPLYTNSPVSFSLNESAAFRDAMKAQQFRSNEERADKQPAAVLDEIRTAVRLAPDVATKAALVLTWICAGRVGDVLKVKRKEVALEHNFATTGDLKVTFVRGKGARFSQPYAVPTTCPLEWLPLLRQYLSQFKPEDWLFPGGTKVYGPLTSVALRTANPTFTVRALRRGALQAMAESGVPDATLLYFSGHKRLDTLWNYLNWSAASADKAKRAREAAVHLAH